MKVQLSQQPHSKVVFYTFLVVLPAIIFYSILFRQALDIPILDDYDALLNFLNHMRQAQSLSARYTYFLASQHNEYKLFFEHALFWLQFNLLGQVDFRLLCALGNSFVLLLAAVLWMMFIPRHQNLADRLKFFVPVSWMIFQLQYVETLDWAMGSLQNLPVVVFSLSSIYLLVSANRWRYCGAAACMVMAIGSSGNGFLVIPVGVLVLAVERQYVRLVGWLAVSSVCVATYSYHYYAVTSQGTAKKSVFSTLLHLRPLYAISFLGSAAGHPNRIGGFARALILGFLLCLFFAYSAYRGYLRKNPRVAYCVLFLFLTAVGVAGLRSGFVVAQSLSSRYTLYSVLLLVFAWFITVEEFLLHREYSRSRSRCYGSVVTAAVIFSLVMDVYGWLTLTHRNRDLVEGMSLYEHNPSSKSFSGPVLFQPGQAEMFDTLDVRARAILIRSTKLGIYQPPMY